MIACLLLAACNTTATKQAAVEPVDDLQAGAQAYAKFHQTGQLAELQAAVEYLTLAYQKEPESAAVQKYYYLAKYFHYIVYRDEDIDSLKSLYQQLNPLVQKQSPPPSRVKYATVSDSDTSRETIDPIVKAMIQEQPFNAGSWHALSEYYEQVKDYWMAIATAKRAVQLEPANAEYMYQLGDSINDVIQLTECRYDQQHYAKAAVSHIAKAAAKSPNQLYLDNSGLQYLRLGLFPLAYSQLEKAWEMEKNWWTATHLAQAAILTGRYQEAAPAVQYLISEAGDMSSYRLEAQRLIGLKQFDAALAVVSTLETKIESNKNAKEKFYVSVFDSLQLSWLKSLLIEEKLAANTYSTRAAVDWSKTVADYFALENWETDYLVLQSLNSCEQTEAWFYQAYASWLQDDSAAAVEQLKNTRSSAATLFTEYLWAQVLLDSGLLEH